MTTPAAERRHKLKSALIDAAERTIARDGLAPLRARDLATGAGCAVGAIYTAFPDLDAIVIEVNMRTLALLDRQLREVSGSQPASADAGPEDRDLARLVRLDLGYLTFAAEHGPRWRALFEHRLPDGQAVPAWYVIEQNRIFSFVEAPLRAIRPDLTVAKLATLARTLFSAVHGGVSLGLEQKLGDMPPRRLREAATARGLLGPAPAPATKRSAATVRP